MAFATSSPAGAFLGFLVVDVGAPLHRAKTMMVPPRLGLCYKPGRLVAVAATAAAAAPAPGPEEDGDRRLSSDEEVASKFRSEMEAFKLSYHPLTLFPTPSEMEAFKLCYHPLTLFAMPLGTVEVACGTAVGCMRMLEFLLSKQAVRPEIHQGFVLAGKAFLTIEHNAVQEGLRADALINGIQGLKLIGKVFFERELLPEDKVPGFPSSSKDDIIDKESFCTELVRLLELHRATVYAAAKSNYSYDTHGANDDLPSADCERAVSDFRTEMDAFRASLRQTAVVRRTHLVEAALREATTSLTVLEFLLAESTGHWNTRIPKELIAAGKAFLVIEHQIERHYLVEDDLVNGILGLQAIGKEFFGIDLTYRYPVPSVQFFVDRDNLREFSQRLVRTFCASSEAVRSYAMELYGFTSETN